MFKIFITYLFISLTSAYSFSQTLPDSSKATLSGYVFSDENIKLGNILISFSNQNFNESVLTDGNGKYKIELEQGLYNKSVKNPG